MKKTISSNFVIFSLVSSFFLLISFSLFLLLKNFFQNPKINIVSSNQNNTLSAQQEWVSPKKGLGGPVTNQTAEQAKISWYYNWWVTPPSGLWQTDSDARFVPLFAANRLNWCLTQEDLNLIDSRAQSVCNGNYCNRGNYYLIGNEPFELFQDLRNNSPDPVLDAVNCYGEIIRRIKAKDPTAKFILLGLAYPEGDRLDKAKQFVQRWKNYWQAKDNSIANLSQIIKGWHLHTYHNYNACPNDDSRIVNFKREIDSTLQLTYDQGISEEEFWVTEMGSLTSPANPTETEKQQFLHLMECLVNAYERSSVVNRYAWFYHGCLTLPNAYCDTQWDKTALFNRLSDNSGYLINYLGEKYRSLGYSSSGPPTPTPTFPPCEGPAEKISESTVDYISNVITSSSGWSYGSPVKFTPSFSGKLDRAELLLSGSGKMEIKVRNSWGKQIGEIVSKNINQGKGWAIFDFLNEEIINSLDGEHYLDFRVVSGTITLYRGNSWSWAHRIWAKRCEISSVSPSPTITPIITPSVTPPPSTDSCNGPSQLTAFNNSNYIETQINSSWSYGSPIYFNPVILGKIDKIKLYAKGNGRLETRVKDLQGNQLTEITSLNINLSSPNWVTLDFATEPILTPALDGSKNYILDFRAASGTITLYRGNSWSWAYQIYIRPCGNVSLTPTTASQLSPSPTSSNTPTPSTPSEANSPPVITTNPYFPDGKVNSSYKPGGQTFYVEGYDLNLNDSLIMKVYGLPPGLSLGYCNSFIENNFKKIKCPINGTPTQTGKYYGNIRLSDGKTETIKNFSISINN